MNNILFIYFYTSHYRCDGKSEFSEVHQAHCVGRLHNHCLRCNTNFEQQVYYAKEFFYEQYG